jgi:hypothetical protein
VAYLLPQRPSFSSTCCSGLSNGVRKGVQQYHVFYDFVACGNQNWHVGVVRTFCQIGRGDGRSLSDFIVLLVLEDGQPMLI